LKTKVNLTFLKIVSFYTNLNFRAFSGLVVHRASKSRAWPRVSKCSFYWAMVETS